MVGTSFVSKVDEGKLVEGRLALGTPEIDGLKRDKVSKSKEYELLKLKNDDPKGGIG